MWRWLLVFLLVSGAALGLILGALNPTETTVDIAVYQFSASLGAIVACALAIGLLIGLSIGIVLTGMARNYKPRVSLPNKDADAGLPDA
ncbi:MAG: hypothetical protein RQ741_03470 [Wenzhouxiangellaceae bacterium]|nr:hypothetical protein [Wenzhouxiangellaceae bacterium]